jgi:predicted dehydrogenase
MKLRVGVIGAGRIGQIAHLQHFAADPRCTVVALADLRPDLARSVADKFGIAKVYGHHAALLADPEVDAVVVITHRYHTAAVVRDALMAGKHVLSEKPMAFDAETARALAELAARHSLVYAVGYMKRHDPWVALARRAMAAELGAARLIRIHCFVGEPDRTDSFVMTQESRPPGDLAAAAPPWLPAGLRPCYDRFLNVYSHDLDLALFLGGDDLRLAYATRFGDDGHHIVLRNEALTVTIDCAALPGRAWREGFEAVCAHGVISVCLPWPLDPDAQGDVTVQGRGQLPLAPSRDVWAFKAQAADFVSAALSGAAPGSPASSAVRTLECTAEIFERYSHDLAAGAAQFLQGEKHVAH